jgi:TolB protein
VFERDTAVTALAWSPSGDRLAFTAGVDGNDLEFQRMTLYVVEADGSGLSAMSDLPVDGARISWSPDGQWLAFAAYRQERLDLYAVPVEGGAPRRLTDARQYAAAPDWSPDCRSIAYVSGDVGGDDIRVLGADGSGDRLVAETPLTVPASNARSPVWSPDGRRIAYYVDLPSAEDIPDPELFVVDADGTHILQLTGRQDGVNDGLSWFPDSGALLFGALGPPPTGHPDRPGGTGWETVVVTIDATERRPFLDPASGIEDPHEAVLATPD